MALTDKQKKFCEEYLIDLNGTQAAIRAGYSERTANEQAARLLANVSISEYLQSRQKELQEKTGITQERVLAEYAKIAFSDVRKYYDEDGRLLPIKELEDDVAAALAGVEVDELFAQSEKGKVQIGETKKIKRFDKVKALDSLARILGMFSKDNEQKKPVVHISGMEIK